MDLTARPGLLFVIATFLPLLSFVLILLAGMAWALLRPYRDTHWGAPLYKLCGGDGGGLVAPIVATSAIGLPFVFSFIGLVLYLQDSHHPSPLRDCVRVRFLPCFAFTLYSSKA